MRRKADVTQELWVGLACAMVAMGVFGLFNWWGWVGDPHHCAVVWDASGPTDQVREIHQCFCEEFDIEDVRGQRPGIRQFSNTLSNIVPLITGLILAARSGLDRFDDKLLADSDEDTWGWYYPLVFVLVVGFMGPGSMFLHASITEWGGYVDNLSMFLFVWFLFAYGAYVRVSRQHHSTQKLVFSGLFVGGTLLSMGILMFTDVYVKGQASWLLAPAGLYVVAELYLQWTGRKLQTWWFWCAVVAFAGAIFIWSLSTQYGEALCLGDRQGTLGPRSLIQAHGVWHILANLTAVFLFLHFRGTDSPLTS